MQVYFEGADVLSLGIRRTLLAYRINLIDAITLSVVVQQNVTCGYRGLQGRALITQPIAVEL